MYVPKGVKEMDGDLVDRAEAVAEQIFKRFERTARSKGFDAAKHLIEKYGRAKSLMWKYLAVENQLHNNTSTAS